jgi:hypothetical protein
LLQKNNVSNKTLIFLIFGFFFLVNIISSGAHFDSWDGVETFLVTESMVLKHSTKLYPDVPSVDKLYFDIHHSVSVNEALQTGKSDNRIQPMYTSRSLFLSAIAVPFYYTAVIFSVSPITVVAVFVNSLIISLISVVVFCFSLEIYGSKKIAFVLSLLLGVCSFIWPYHDSLFPQPLETLCIITSAFLLYISAKQYNDGITNNNRRGIYFAGLAGLFLGLSVLAHPTSTIIIPGFIAYSIFLMRHNKKSLGCFLIALSIILFFVGFINYWRFGSITDFGYGPYGSFAEHGSLKGLVGLLASPGAGLIFFFPISILLPISFIYMYKKNRGLFLLSAYVIVVSWLYFGTISYAEPAGWSGAGGWGPRYLIPILPFVTIVSGALFVNLKQSRFFLKPIIAILFVAGFLINSLAVLVWYMYGYSYGWGVEQLWKVDNKANVTGVNSMDIMTWNAYYSPILLHIRALISDYASHLQPTHDWTSYGLAPCSYNIYLSCKFGIIPILLLSAVIVVIAWRIMIESYYDRPNTRINETERN